jgi:MFS transporter, MHS family, proline/betaine transporter
VCAFPLLPSEGNHFMTTIISTKDDAATSSTQGQVINTAVCATLAWSCDLFDLFIILFVAPQIGELFFPSSSPILSLAAVYASYAITLFMRPLGSAIFGPYADRHGRRKAMIVSVAGIGIVTGLMGFLPTIGQVGLLAPISFIALRVLQGVFVGGVVSSSHTIGTETVGASRRGLMSGIIGAGAAIGSLLASAMYFLVSHIFPGDAFLAWGWRVMFFGGFIGAALSAFAHRTVQESPIWLEAAPKDTGSPLQVLLSRQYLGINAVNMIIVIGAATQIYLTQSFLPAFLKLVNKVPAYDLGGILVVANFVAILATPLFGSLSDRFGRKRIFIFLGASNLLLIPLCYILLTSLSSDTLGLIYLYAGILTFCGNASLAPIIIFLNERFPTPLRATGTSLSWNVGFALGGMMPTFVTLASRTPENMPATVLVFLIIAIVLYGAGAIIVPETQGRMDQFV